MEKRKLGDSDLLLSVVGLGCWQLDTNHWGTTEPECIATVHAPGAASIRPRLQRPCPLRPPHIS